MPQSSSSSSPSPVLVRVATPADADTIARHRADMFRDMGRLSDALYEPFRTASARYFANALSTGEYAGWLAVPCDHEEPVVAGAGILIRPMAPSVNANGTVIVDEPQGLIVNVYTEPAWRRQGIARLVLQHVIDWARGTGLRNIVLHASSDGRPLYEQMGFVPTNEMRYAGGS
jgi:GNAT superfamily N-acetyltransferase